MSLGFQIINPENIDINIIHLQDDIYILIYGLNYILFNINIFKKIKNYNSINIKQRNILFFNSLKENFEIIKKDIITNKVIERFSEQTDEQRHKMKYLSNNMFVGIYPNKFFIFENNKDSI